MNEIFDLCVLVLVKMAKFFGMTYQEINVWIFVIIWPLFSIGIIVLVLIQNFKIKAMKKLIDGEEDEN